MLSSKTYSALTEINRIGGEEAGENLNVSCDKSAPDEKNIKSITNFSMWDIGTSKKNLP